VSCSTRLARHAREVALRRFGEARIEKIGHSQAEHRVDRQERQAFVRGRRVTAVRQSELEQARIGKRALQPLLQGGETIIHPPLPPGPQAGACLVQLKDPMRLRLLKFIQTKKALPDDVFVRHKAPVAANPASCRGCRPS